MNAQELFLSDGTSAGIYYCSECKFVKYKKEEAEKCCEIRYCKHCGKALEPHHSFCSDIKCKADRTLAKYEDPKRERILEKDWAGWVCEEDSDMYYSSVDDFREQMEYEFDENNNPVPIPKYVWACKEIPFVGINSENIYESIVEEMWEDAYDSLCGTGEFEEAAKAFNEANKHLISYAPDYSKVIVMESESVEENGN